MVEDFLKCLFSRGSGNTSIGPPLLLVLIRWMMWRPQAGMVQEHCQRYLSPSTGCGQGSSGISNVEQVARLPCLESGWWRPGLSLEMLNLKRVPADCATNHAGGQICVKKVDFGLQSQFNVCLSVSARNFNQTRFSGYTTV